MYGEGRNYRMFIGLGAVIVLLFLIIFLIVRSGGSDNQGDVAETKRELISYTNDPNVTVTQTTIGAVVAPQNHYETEIEVSNGQATINVINGYDGNVISTRNYPMTNQAFVEFLSALDKAAFTKGDTAKELEEDEGYCSTGQRYVFAIRDGSNNIQRFWTTNCRSTPKTFQGNTTLVLSLFQSQIPDYDDITNDINLNSGSIF